MKKVLIVGTSHTSGACQNQAALDHYNSVKRERRKFTDADFDISQADWLPEENRWYQGLLKDYEVTTLSTPGASPAQQYWAIMNYHHQYPESKFDAAILEGRHPPSASQPSWMDFGHVDTFENRLKLWLGPWPEAGRLML